MDTLDDYISHRPPTAARPLLGLTVLIVEDSRYASEAMRLLCLRSGARIRRADTLFAARRHLKVYRPGALLVDLGLPDGSGADLIAELAGATPRIDVILGMSGDPGGQEAAMAAGADGFIAKPIARIAEFQALILRHLPPSRRPPQPHPLTDDRIQPDPLAYRDDLTHAAGILLGSGALPGEARIDYLTQFLGGVAQSAGDLGLCEVVEALAETRRSGAAPEPVLSRLTSLVERRLAQSPAI